jgi:serine/threonine-protein kinase
MQFDHFLLPSCLNDGPDASIWSGADVETQCPVCLKISKTERQVPQECESLLFLQLPSIIRVLEIISDPDRTVLVMPWAEGGCLLDWVLNYGPIDEFNLKKVLSDILDGLSFMHEQGFWHCDVKQDNILPTSSDLTESGYWLSDFGFACWLEPGTVTGNALGILQ